MSVVLPTLGSPVKITFILTSLSPSIISQNIQIINSGGLGGDTLCLAIPVKIVVAIINCYESRPAETGLLDRPVYGLHPYMRICLIVFISGFHDCLDVVSHSNVRLRRCFEVGHSFFRCIILDLFSSNQMLEICLAAHQKQRAFHLIKLEGLHPNGKPLERVPVVEAKAQAHCVGIQMEAELLRQSGFFMVLDLSPPAGIPKHSVRCCLTNLINFLLEVYANCALESGELFFDLPTNERGLANRRLSREDDLQSNIFLHAKLKYLNNQFWWLKGHSRLFWRLTRKS